jgi:hypothetical protein
MTDTERHELPIEAPPGVVPRRLYNVIGELLSFTAALDAAADPDNEPEPQSKKRGQR